MESKDARRFVKEVARELRDLGPFELRKALADIKADLVDFAMDGEQAVPTLGRLAEARRAMPSAHEVAQTYMASAKPPKTMIRLSFIYNLLLFLGPLYLAATVIQASLLPPGSQTSFPPLILAIVLFLPVGVFGILVYGIALFSPVHAMRWRFAILPGIAVTLVTDFILAVVILKQLQVVEIWIPWLSLVVLLCGIYSAGYAHAQLPRLVPKHLEARHGRNYFRTIGGHLRDFDLTSRLNIITELKGHLEGAGIDLAKLPPSDRYSAAAKVLGSAEEVASAYLHEVKPESSRRQRSIMTLVLLVSLVGGALGSILLWAIFTAVVWGTTYPLPVALLGSAGLLVLSIAGLAGVLHLRRSPLHWPDFGPPTVATALACALCLIYVVGGLSSGDFERPITLTNYSVEAQHRSADGGVDVIWSSWEGSPSGIPFFPFGNTLTGIKLAHLDDDMKVVFTEPLPIDQSLIPVVALGHDGDTWVVLSATHLYAFGGDHIDVDLSPLPGYNTVTGRIDGTMAHIAWSGSSVDPITNNHLLSLAFSRFRWVVPSDRVSWTRVFEFPPDYSLLEIRTAIGDDRVLLVQGTKEENETYVQASVDAFLLDIDGNSVANMTLAQNHIQRWGYQDFLNSTSVMINGVHAVPGAFWVIGNTFAEANGTNDISFWAIRIDARNGSVTKHDLLHSAFIDPFGIYFQESVVSGDRVLVVTYAMNSTSLSNQTTDGLFISNILTNGGVKYTIRLDNSLIDGWQAWPILAGWNGTPMILVPLFTSDCCESMRVMTYTVTEPSLAIMKGEMTVGVSEAAFLWYALVDYLGGVDLDDGGVGPNVVQLAGAVVIEDYGLFGWRKNAGYENLHAAFVPAPAIVRFDIALGRTRVVLLAQPEKLPDAMAGMFTVSVATALSVTTLMLGYPRWRAWRFSRKQHVSTG